MMVAGHLKFYAFLAAGTLSVCLAAIVFFAAVQKPSEAQLAGFYSLIFSEVFTTACLAFMERQNNHLAGTFSRAGIYTSALFYLSVTAVAALLFMTGVLVSVKWLYVFHGVCLGLLFIHFIVVLTVSQSISRSHASVRTVLENFKQLENRLGNIRIRNSKATWCDDVTRCQEEISFFDYSCVVPADALLAAGIARLEKLVDQKNQSPEEFETELSGVLEELLGLVVQRNLEAKNLSRGQF